MPENGCSMAIVKFRDTQGMAIVYAAQVEQYYCNLPRNEITIMIVCADTAGWNVGTVKTERGLQPR